MRPPFRPILSLLLFQFLVCPAAALGAEPAHMWSKSFGNTTDEYARSIAVDLAGNLYVTGQFSGTINLGGANLVGAGGNDVFLAKFDRFGVHQWSQRFGGTGSDSGISVAITPAGNIFLTGVFSGTASFGGVNHVSAGGQDIFLAMYNASGVHQWSNRYGGTANDSSTSVAATSVNNGYLTGFFQNTIDFGTGPLASAGATDLFLLKFNSTGGWMVAQRFGGTLSDQANGVAVDGSDHAVITGSFAGTVNFGGINLVSAFNSTDIFVCKYDGVGNLLLWAKSFGTSSTEIGMAVDFDPSSNVLVTGLYWGTINFGGSTLSDGAQSDAFLVKLNNVGNHVWSKGFPDGAESTGNAVSVDPLGNVALAGDAGQSVDFGGGTHTGFGLTDAFLACFDAAGNYRSSRIAGNTNVDFGVALATDAAGRISTGGLFRISANFGGGVFTAAGGGGDMFLAHYLADPAGPTISDIVDIGNDQGRRVRIDFSRSAHDDAGSGSQVLQYEAYRRNDPAPALVGGASSLEELLAAGWTKVADVPAHGETQYSMEAPTIGDSTVALGQYHSVFYVRASTGAPTVFFDSPVDSGYSLDNLAPGIPLNFVYESGGLEWDESDDEDFDFFTVYGSNTDAFASATLVNYTTSPALDVSASPYVFYWVTATDFSGNEGKPARVNTLTGTGGTPKSYVLSVSNYPNPFNPRTTVSYTLPARGRVTVAVFDARGSLVATLVDDDKPAGAYTLEWNPGAAVSSGIYFARIHHNGETKSKKMVLLK